MEFRKVLAAAIKQSPAIPTRNGATAAGLAIEVVNSVDHIRRPSASKIAEIERVARRVAGTEWGQEILKEGARAVLEALDRSRFKKVLAVARYIAALLDWLGVDEIDVGNSFLNWIIETALQALKQESA